MFLANVDIDVGHSNPLVAAKNLKLMSCLVFAYGSNMCRERMINRVSSAIPLGTGVLQRHRLTFHKRGMDGSAKANAFYTGSACDATWGVLFRIDVTQKPMLDQFESVGVGYETVMKGIQTAGGKVVQAWTYIALSVAVEGGLKPFTWYKDFVIQGARQHDLPSEYIRILQSTDAVHDSDTLRSQANARILAGVTDHCDGAV